NLPDIDGLSVLEEMMALNDHPPVIMLTAYSDISFVKQAIRAGAYDYILKPYDLKELEGTIRRAAQNIEIRKQFATGRSEEILDCFIGESQPMRELKGQLLKYGSTDSIVLIQGESGTGKELVARSLHRLSPRRASPFVAVNCGAIPETLLESELFGSEKGAYTDAVTRPGCFEQANEGTLFLDEIGELKPQAQVKLLRILEEKELRRVGGIHRIPLNLRVLSATNRNLKQEMEKGRFREDLYYRINVLPVSVPPLRQRPEDIPILAAHFCKIISGEGKKLGPAAVETLIRHPWPGNIRELRNVIERAVVLAEGREITVRDVVLN
ncbi:MAG: sigma-54-dependent Fis family transcriptional regulator, partial [Planctomycetes bacterium]|nr:sigma-54-dependent Fis family transcriptional regulator [Planctomycetota bacterium]